MHASFMYFDLVYLLHIHNIPLCIRNQYVIRMMAKRIQYSIDTKLAAIEEVENNAKSKSEIAISFVIPPSTL